MLAPRLYKALKSISGRVQVHSPGERVTTQGKSSWLSSRKRSNKEIKGGERYSVTCPYCQRKNKLWLSYKIEEIDIDTIVNGRGFINCFRCEFQKDRKTLRDYLVKLGKVVGGTTPSEDIIAFEKEPERNERPYPVTFSLMEEDGYLFREYLKSRRFDPKVMDKDWGLRCSGDPLWFTTGRLLIPITCNAKHVGWQARHLDGPGDDGEEKYLFPPGFLKASWLYNQDRAMYAARRKGMVVICEGVFDVFRVGHHAVSIFGKTASDTQINKLISLFKGVTAVVLLDNEADARKDAMKLTLRLQASGAFKEVKDLYFPDGDPADQTEEDIIKLLGKSGIM